MIDFKVCYPDANSFDNVIKIKNIKDWNVEFVKLDSEIGYWIVDDPFENNGFEIFKNLVGTFPIQKDNNRSDNFDPNPFDTIHVPEWVSKSLCLSVKDFYLTINNRPIYEPQIHEWGNVFFKERSRPISCWRIPHIDYVNGIVANLWFTNHEVFDSGTKLYKYIGNMQGEIYDFQIDENHKLHKEWKQLSENPTRADSWFNIDDKELERWGFFYLGTAPSKYKTMTMYRSDVCHLAYISKNVEFRWSHAFAFSHLDNNNNYFSFGDIFK